MKMRRHQFEWMRRSQLALAVSAACLAAGNASAFEIDTGNSDVAVRWDNTVRYNAGWRAQGRDSAISKNSFYDEGDALFNKGDMVTNRLDLLTEFDFVYKKDLGFRVSGAGWYDGAYGSHGSSNPNARVTVAGAPKGTTIAAPSSYVNNEFSSYTKRYTEGPSGELLDAFVFANFDAGDTPVKLKVGRHTIFWGESLLLNGALHGIAYSQMPLDIQKGQATPGAEAKELFRPLNQISAQAQVTDTLSLAAQYFLQWESYRFPEGGTYLAPADFAFEGPNRLVAAQVVTNPALGAASGALLGYSNGGAIKPKDAGEFGLAARWSPEFLDGTAGLYYRRYADKIPQVLLTRFTPLGAVPGATLVGPAAALATQPYLPGSRYNLVYGKDVDLYGISFAKNLGGVSLGAELSYRHNTPLSAKVLGASLVDGEGPRGDTMHGLVNLLGTIAKTPLFDIANWATEVTWSRLEKVSEHPELFNGVGYGGCTVVAGVQPKWSGCATRDYVGFGGSFTPTWYQVAPSVDLSMPLTYSMGIRGNAATMFGGNDGLGNYSIGLGMDIQQKYRIDLKYISYLGHYTSIGSAPLITQNGINALISDRSWVSLTLKTTF